MILTVLSDWTITPEFAGNKDMILTLHQLSGIEEVNLGIGDKRDPVEFIRKVVKKIDNPIELDFADGKKPRKMKAEDIAKIGALKDLYFEIIIAYHDKTVVGEETSKN